MKQLLQLRVTARGLVEGFAGMAALGTLAALLGDFAWPLELATHFRVQYAVALLLAAVSWPLIPPLAGPAPRRLGSRLGFPFACVVLAAINLAVLRPYLGFCLTPASTEAPGESRIRLVALNVHTGNARHDLVEAFLRASEADVILLTEVDDRWLTQLAGLTNRWPHQLREPRDDNFGIALLSRWPWTQARVITLGEAELPSVEARIVRGDRRLWVIGTHPLPPGTSAQAALRDGQLQAIARRVAELAGPRVLAGDLNATPWSPAFRGLEQRSGLRDTLRGRGYQASWPAGFPLFGIPLDHALVSPDLRVLDRRLGPRVGSDHRPLILELALP